jgi:hypothetical protein
MRSVKLGLCLAACAAVLCADSVSADMIFQGTRELGLNGRLEADSIDGPLFEFDALWGRFVRDYWQLGFLGGLSTSDTLTRIRAGVYTEFNLELGQNYLPFIGLSLNGLAADLDFDDPARPSGSDAGFGLGVNFGVKGFLTRNVALSGGIELLWATEDVFLRETSAEDNDIRLTIGLRYYY